MIRTCLLICTVLLTFAVTRSQAAQGAGRSPSGKRKDAAKDVGNARHKDRAATLKQGIEALEKHENAKALKIFNEILRKDPKNAKALAQRGRAHLRLGNNDKAFADCSKAIELDPKLPVGYIGRGVYYFHKEATDKAIADLSQAIRLNPKYAHAYRIRGSFFAAKREFDKALADINQAIKLKPNDAEFYVARGNVYWDLRDHKKAIADLNRAIKLNPKLVAAYGNRGYAYAKMGKIDKAIADYNQAIKLDPKSAVTYYYRGNVYADQGKYDKAIGDFSQAIKFKPKDAEFYGRRGDVYSEKGNYDKAIADFQRAIKLKPKNAQLYVWRGLHFARMGNDAQAFADYSHAVKLDPKHTEGYVLRGTIFARKKKYGKAIADFSQAIKLNPKDAFFFVCRGHAHFNKGELDKALADYSRAIKLNPKDAHLYYHRGEVYANQQKFNKAIADFSQAIKLKPKDTNLYYDRGYAYLATGQNDNAIADFSEAIQLDPKNPDFYFYRGHAFAGKGQSDKAIADFSQAIKINSKHALSYFYRGKAYSLKGDVKKAIADFSRAIKLQPKDPDFYYHRGRSYGKNGDFSKAAADLSEAIKLRPKDSSFYFYRGLAYTELGDYQKAAAEYRLVIKLQRPFAPAYDRLAWLLATCPEKKFRNGKEAIKYASSACNLAEWKDPQFLDTLAAAYAEAGQFAAAVKWQEAALQFREFAKHYGRASFKRLLLYREQIAYREMEKVAKNAKDPVDVKQKPLKNNPALRRELQQFFDKMGRDFNTQSPQKAVPYIDLGRLWEVMRKELGLPRKDKQEQKEYVHFMRLRFSQKKDWLNIGWTRSEIKSVQLLPGGREAAVYVRHFDANTSLNSPARWWVRKEGKRWRYFDCEDLHTGLRVSDVGVTAAVEAMAGLKPTWVKAVLSLQKIGGAFLRNDIPGAERGLQAIKNVDFPKKIDAVRWFMHGKIALIRGRFGEALQLCDRAEGLNADLIVVSYLRACTFNGLGHYKTAQVHLQKYIDVLGEDNDASFQLGVSLAGLNRQKEAAKAFRRSLKFDSQYADSIDGLRYVLPDRDKQEIARYFQKLKRPKVYYQALANNAFGDGDGVGLEILANAMLARSPKNPEVIFHQARAKVLQRQHKNALPFYLLALKHQANKNLRRQYLQTMLYDMVDGELAAEGYRLAPDAKEAFPILAQDLLTFPKLAALRQLLDAHRVKHPQDHWLAYYEGQLAISKSDYAGAETHFAKIDLNKLDDKLRKVFVSGRVFAFIQSGKGLEAYEKLPLKKEVFQQLAASFSRSRDTKKLKALIERHRPKQANDPNLPIWEIEVHWLNKNHAALVKALTGRRAVLDDRRYSYKMYDRLFLALYAMKRDAQAEQEIRRLVSKGTSQDWNQLRSLFSLLQNRKNKREAVHFASVCQKAAADNPQALMLAMRAYILDGQLKQAVELFQRVHHLQKTGPNRANCQSNFLFAMIDAGRSVPGYLSAPDKRSAFRLIANDLTRQRKPAELLSLIEAHQKNLPKDPLLGYFRGESALAKKQYQRAEKFFTASLKNFNKEFEQDKIRRKLLFARFHHAGAAAAYKKTGPNLFTFLQLANLCTRPERPQQLTQLIAVHRKHFPEDPMLLLWGIEVQWLRKDYQKVVNALRKHKNNKHILAFNNQYWRDQHLIRSLIRLGLFQEAKKELVALKRQGRQDLLLEAAAHACAGDVKATAASLDLCKKRVISILSLYNDPDLGAALRSERFRELRQQYPEPKNEKSGTFP